MPRFCVTFLKVVYGSTGQACTICQRVVEVDAHDMGAAQTTAAQRFCGLENVGNWIDHADWMEIAPAAPAQKHRVGPIHRERQAA